MNKENKQAQAVTKSEVAVREEEMLAFWAKHDVFNKSVETPAGDTPVGDFVFYDGPPFATGLPHYGHILAGTVKDAIPRFWTMNGYRVRRQWGWDCHGLPLENVIEKKLGLATKRDIEEYGIKNFNEAARGAVMEYADDWKKIVPRMGRFVNMEDDYKTMDTTYTETVWWVFKSLHDKGLVFEGFKSMHMCPRCGTTLSNFEVNQNYQDIKDLSVFVELPLLEEEDTSLLVWTTTPWTLPGNLAVAVNKELDYALVEHTSEAGEAKKIIVAKDRVESVLGDREHKVLKTVKGADLVGKKYEPPFLYLKQMFENKPYNFPKEQEHLEKAWQVYHADFVEVGEEGTGLVHIAPAFGEDDLNLAKAHGVPIVHHVDESGRFMDFVSDFAGKLVKPKDDKSSDVSHMDADIEIIRALASKGILFAKEKITHSYPHCWRCDTPLLNYATTSWFVDVPAIREELVAANERVKWVPEHIGTNRFGKWLEGARDWAVSRQRYWGAPLPIWKNPETKEHKVIGSVSELQEYIPQSSNSYFVMRHGQAHSNLSHTISTDINKPDLLTEEGVEQVKEASQKLKAEKIDLIISSPFHRTKATAEIIKDELGLSEEQLILDERIQEIQVGNDFQGKDWSEHFALYDEDFATEFERKVEGVPENRLDVQRRVGDMLYDLESKYGNKNILLVGHVSSTFATACVTAGADVSEAIKMKDNFWLGNAEFKKVDFSPLPHNDNYQLDLHRPYIDEIELYEGETKLERVPDVFDCWFESGSMPYAQHHYPFENKETFEKEHFPAQFIAEGLDQTRGWFYSLIVLGTALFGKSPFENVIVNGLVLAEDGKKMSKSLQNYPDPMELADQMGVDAMRFYLLSSPVVRGEDLNFSEKEVLELQRKNIGRLHNVLQMYEMFSDGTLSSDDSDNVLDQWIVARSQQLVGEVTEGFKKYELEKATRPITDYIDDLSVWYLRRSRDRLKGEAVADRQQALATLRYALRTLALTMAPSMPFYAEYLWQAVKEDDDQESVHLAKWPEVTEPDPVVVGEMSMVREFVNAALELRTKSGLRVRQPLASLRLNVEMEPQYLDIIADEVNVKQVVYDADLKERVSLDTELTPDLIAEGAVRELMRAVQGKRKQEGLEPQDEIKLIIHTDQAGQEAIAAHQELLTKTVGATTLEYQENDGEQVEAGDFRLTFSVIKE